MSDWSQPGSEPTTPQYGQPYGGPPAAGQYPADPNPYGEQHPYAAQPSPYAQTPYPQQSPYGPYPYPPAYGPYAPVPPGERRPGTLTAAAVLGYVAGGLLILAGFLLFFGASVVTDIENRIDTQTSFAAEFAIAGVANLIAAGLLIAGSVSMTARNVNGRTMYIVGSGIVIAATVYWLARWATRSGGQPLIVYALIFAALVIVGLALSFTRADNAWLAGKR